ncbi:MAG: nitroreductase [Marinicaulis sp.]|nr:nitroreductase [Marinicaulis sp.]NNE42032.1 nitroreductase [Marinicaulis sp.]NNL89489.1 nitroreductase [Marinicaulis sp.]
MSTKPEFGEILPAATGSEELLQVLRRRRSTTVKTMTGPGPSKSEIADMLEIAARVPDHRCVAPFRFIVFEDEARERIGDLLATVHAANQPGASDKEIELERARFTRAPLVVGVVSSVNPEHKTPVWEQQLTSGVACYNLLLAASGHGYAAQWITEWYAVDARVTTELGLAENERIAGFIYMGAAEDDPRERARPDVEEITEWY